MRTRKHDQTLRKTYFPKLVAKLAGLAESSPAHCYAETTSAPRVLIGGDRQFRFSPWWPAALAKDFLDRTFGGCRIPPVRLLDCTKVEQCPLRHEFPTSQGSLHTTDDIARSANVG